MFLAVVCGAFFGILLSVIVAPAFGFAFAIMGAMTFGAVAVALMLFTPEQNEVHSNARSEEDVRKALSDIEARKK